MNKQHTLSQAFVKRKLLELEGKLLKPRYRRQWSKANPCFGYCYVVSEAIYHFHSKPTKAFCINLGDRIGTHWFLAGADNNIIDFTAEQFSFDIPYEKAKRKAFLQGGLKAPRGRISRRGFQMAKHLGLTG